MLASPPIDPSLRPSVHRRPLSVIVAAWAFIVVGAGGILKDALPLVGPHRAAALDALLVEGAPMLAFIWFVRALAVVGGIAVLFRRGWARWLLVGWMLLHVGLSLFHSLTEAAAHVVIFSLLTAALFAGPAAAYFAARRR